MAEVGVLAPVDPFVPEELKLAAEEDLPFSLPLSLEVPKARVSGSQT